MKEFMMLFHSVPDMTQQPTQEQIQASLKRWQDWIGGIAAQGKFSSTEALGYNGKTLHHDGMVTDGPYTEVKEMIGGYLICKAESLEEAFELAKGCPILAEGGKVEVRDIMVFDM